MLDIGWSELLFVAVIALLIIGPKDLPRALYTVGKWVRAARKVTRDFQKHVDDMMRETELDEIRKGVQKAQSVNVKKQIENTIDPKGEMKVSLDPGRDSGSGTKKSKPADEGETSGRPRSGITAEAAREARPTSDGGTRDTDVVEAGPVPAEAAAASDKTV